MSPDQTAVQLVNDCTSCVMSSRGCSLWSMNHFLTMRTTGEFCPLCYAGLKGRAVYKGHYGYREGKGMARLSCMALAKRSPASADASGGGSPPGGGDWEKRYPTVVEFLSRSTWEDGTSRQTGTLMLLTEAGLWKGWFHCRTNGESMWLSGETPADVLASAEKALSTGKGDWRPDKGKRR